MTIQLYPDQMEFVDDIRQALRTSKAVLGVAPTGMGKTVVSAYIAKQAASRGATVWFVCHLKNLLMQTSNSFWGFKVEHGVIASGRGTTPSKVQVALIGTLANRIGKSIHKAPDLMILDETHYAMAASWLKVVEWCKEQGTIIIGNSATPERLDGKGLGYIFDKMVESKPLGWMIDNHRLSDYVMYSGRELPDYSKIKTQGGDYKTSDMAQEMSKPKIIGDAADHWEKYAPGKRTILYASSIEHSKRTVQMLNHRGIPAVHVDGTTNANEIKQSIADFADGRYKILSNVQLMTTGFDLSAQVGRDVPIEAGILLRGTKSLALYLQMVGRVLRYKDYPAIILDHACCAMEHGMPDDIRDWSLEGRSKGKRRPRDELEKSNTCADCGVIYRIMLNACPVCGSETLRSGGRTAPEEIDGELVRVERERHIRESRKEQGMSRTLQDLVELGVRRGVKNPSGWAANVFCSRQGRRPSGQDYREAKMALIKIQGG